ncbi:MAG: hypothetical protein OXM61_10915 [Candidatus Poribacteria bacterium]|nr:hypothetical protein [Candidatus Poribacteria bacterium]
MAEKLVSLKSETDFRFELEKVVEGVLSDEALSGAALVGALEMSLSQRIEERAKALKAEKLSDLEQRRQVALEIQEKPESKAEQELAFESEKRARFEAKELEESNFILDYIQNEVSVIFTRLIPRFITDEHREFIVCRHAEGDLSASAVIKLIEQDPTFNRLAQVRELDLQVLKGVLVHRLSYLKKCNSRFPKKYEQIWRDARERHKFALDDTPLSPRLEQIALVSKHLQQLDYTLDHGDLSFKEYLQALNTLDRLVARMEKLSASQNEAVIANITDSPQLHAVLERLIVAVQTNDAFSENSSEFLAFLEYLKVEVGIKDETKALQPGEDEDLVVANS